MMPNLVSWKQTTMAVYIIAALEINMFPALPATTQFQEVGAKSAVTSS